MKVVGLKSAINNQKLESGGWKTRQKPINKCDLPDLPSAVKIGK